MSAVSSLVQGVIKILLLLQSNSLSHAGGIKGSAVGRSRCVIWVTELDFHHRSFIALQQLRSTISSSCHH